MHQSIIFFTACSGNDYELTVEHDRSTQIPGYITEESDGTITDMTTNRKWAGLMDMTHDLKVEIKRWGSNVGD